MRSGFFNSEITGYDSQNMPIYDRAEEASFFAKYFSQFIGNGVYNNPSTSMQVVADSDMTIKVSIGTCFINGYFGWVETDESLEIEETESLSRIDRVVARLSLEDDDRKIYLDVLQGEESTSPTAPELTRNDSVYEIALADISVGLTTVEITDDLITDLRWDTDLCGEVVEILTSESKLDADSSDYIKSLSASNQTVTITYGDDSTSTMTVKGLPSPYSGASYQEGIYNSSSVLSTLNTTTYLYEGIYMLKVAADTTTGIPPLGNEDSEFTGKIYLKTSSTYTGLSSTYAPYIRQDIYYPNPDYDEHYKRTVTYTSSSSITYGDWEKVVETQEEGDYLPLSGGTVTGDTNFDGTVTINNRIEIHQAEDDETGLELYADTPYIDFHYNSSSSDYTSRIIESSSGTLEITGNLIVEELLSAKSKYANDIAYAVMGYDNSHYYTLFWYQEAELVFFVDDQNIGSVSDKRLKTDFAEIDDKFLNAIEELEIQQFKIDNRNGLISFGIIAQDLIEVFEKYEINPDDYEILGKVKYRLDDDTEYYKIEYTQFLILKQKAQDRKIEKLQNQLNKQEEEIAELRDIINELKKA